MYFLAMNVFCKLLISLRPLRCRGFLELIEVRTKSGREISKATHPQQHAQELRSLALDTRAVCRKRRRIYETVLHFYRCVSSRCSESACFKSCMHQELFELMLEVYCGRLKCGSVRLKRPRRTDGKQNRKKGPGSRVNHNKKPRVDFVPKLVTMKRLPLFLSFCVGWSCCIFYIMP